jgi:hypothetical protein
VFALGIGSVSLGFAMPALAQATANEAGVAQARNLGRDALAALDGKRYPEAEELFTRALAHHEAPTLRLGRARARVGMGHWVEALLDYDAVVAAVPTSGPGAPTGVAVSPFATAQREASEERRALQARVPHLTLVFPGAVVPRVNGVPWASASEQSVALNPGTHRITAELGKKAFERSLELKESGSEKVLIQDTEAAETASKGAAPAEAVAIDKPAPEAAVKAPTTAAPQAENSATSKLPPPSEESSGGWGRWIGVGATGVLVAGAVVTGIFALQERNSYKSINGDANYSAGYKRSQRAEALKWAWINTAFTAGAVVAGGVTGYLWLTSDSGTSTSAFAPPNGVGLSLSGVF